MIDLGTEEVVVDNGHLENMEKELDPAYDLNLNWGDEDEYGDVDDVEVVEGDEGIDELCLDMMSEREMAVVKGVEVCSYGGVWC